MLEALPHGVITEMSWPTRIVYGAGALERLPAQLARLGSTHPLVVTDAGVVKAGLAEKVYAVLRAAKIAYDVFDGVHANPTEQDANDGVAAYKKGGCDAIVALGGGSPIDAAKLIQVLTTHAPPLSRYDDATGGDKYIRDDMPPVIAIPTTAGTGSEVGRSGVATLEDTGRKTVIFSPYLLPKAAIVDPELTVGLPPHITAATGMDALTHCLEAYVANGLHPLSDALALDGITRVARALPSAVKNGHDVAARGEMMVAAMEGAIAFQKGLGACHSLAHALTPISGVHHGLANAVTLPYVMEFNLDVAKVRFARIAVALGESPGGSDEALAHMAIDRVRALNRQIGIPSRLRDVGVKEDDLLAIAKKGFVDACHQSNPRKVSEDDLLAIARAAY